MLKKCDCKTRKTNHLKNTFKKDWKGYCLIEKSDYFCTRNGAQVLINTGKRKEIKRKFIFKKRFKKFARNKNECYICTPLNEQRSLKGWQEYQKENEKNIFKKTSRKACQIKKSLLLLHPLIERLANKKVRHVPRHIELTAVPMQIGTKIKRVRESKDLKNH